MKKEKQKENGNYRFSLSENPQYFFVIMGVATIVLVLVGYVIANSIVRDPIIVASIVVSMGLGLLLINFALSRGLEKKIEANRLKSEFIKIVSHQLRAPVSNCQWVSEFLLSEKSGKLEKKQKKYLEILRENMDRVQELITELLTVSRIEGGNLVIEKTHFSLGKLAKEAVSKAEPLAKASNVSVVFKEKEGLPKVFGDPSRVKIILENLIDNAVRYTSKAKLKFLFIKKIHLFFLK